MLSRRNVEIIALLALVALPGVSCGEKPSEGIPPGDGPEQPTGARLLMQVFDTAGNPISTAAVTANGVLRATDGAGRLVLEDLPAGRFVTKVEARGFAPASMAVNLPAGVQSGIEVRLMPLGAPMPFDAEAGAVLEQGPVQVEIPAGGLVDYKGEPVTGMAEATVVPLDPTTASLADLPGPLEGVSADTGAAVSLESILMAEVSLWQDGLPVHIAPGRKARLEMLLPTAFADRYQAGDTIPAWWLDLGAGVWREEGVGTIQPASNDPGKLAWVAEVSHFSWWNCDEPWTDKHCFQVTVTDTAGSPLSGLPVGATGVSYTGASRADVTDGDGHACVDIKRNETATIFVGPSSMSLTATTKTGSGPASDCATNGAACQLVQLSIPRGTPICTPGDSRPCPYNGPTGNEGVGLCQAGRQICNSMGTSWSACEGEVLPQQETCDTPFDEDCDGEANEADGKGCKCSSGEEIACYSGPADTLDVGICQAGTRTCLPSIGRYGSCEGEVLPQPETCATAEDDDCNGSTACGGTPLWSRRFGDASQQSALGIAVDAAGNVLITGKFQGTVDFGGRALTSAGGDDIFVAKLDASGTHLWSYRFGDENDQAAQSVAVDAAGNVLLIGYFAGAVDFGGGSFTSEGSFDIFVAKLDASGAHRWSRRFGDASAQYGQSIVLDNAGNVLLTGLFEGAVGFGGNNLVSAGAEDIFVAKLDASGAHQWSHRFGDAGGQYGQSISLDSGGNILLAGYFAGTVDFGGGPFTSEGSFDIFVAKLSDGGAHLWSRRFGDGSDQYGFEVVADGAGNVLLTGSMAGTANFGGGPLTSAGEYDAFVAKLDASGAHRWSHRFGDAVTQFAQRLAVDGAGNVLLTGSMAGTANFGGGPLTSAGEYDAFVAKLDAGGAHQWSHRFGDGSNQRGQSIAVDGLNNVLLTGDLEGVVDFGGEPLTSAGGSDIFAAKLNP